MNGNDLVGMRLRAGLYQYELAQMLGVPSTIVSNLERGRAPITPEVERHIREVISTPIPLSGKRALIFPFREHVRRPPSANHMGTEGGDGPESEGGIMGGQHPLFTKYTRNWLHEATGYSKGYLSRVSTGNIRLSKSFIDRVCYKLQRPERELFALR